jgi:hypothetical protein
VPLRRDDPAAPGRADGPRSVKPCILHVGIPKTGTTSIQESLFFHLADERFRYVSFGHGHANTILRASFAAGPDDDWLALRRGTSRGRFLARREAHRRRLRRALRRALDRGATPILSAEDGWNHARAALEALRDFLAAEGFEARVVAYLRPIESWLESVFQQNVKWGGAFDAGEVREAPPGIPRHAFARKLAVFGDVFGRSNLVVRRFAPEDLVGGCVVRDFCATLGIDFDSRAAIRANESMSLDSLRFLHAYHRYAFPRKETSHRRVERMVRMLGELPGPRFRIHRQVFAPLADEIRRETTAIREDFGIDLAENPREVADGPCIREAADLERFSRPALDWLARASGRRPIGDCEGEGTARQVAEQVARAGRRAIWRQGPGEAARTLRRGVRWIRHGD